MKPNSLLDVSKILDYTQDEKALKGTCDCSQGKFLNLIFIWCESIIS